MLLACELLGLQTSLRVLAAHLRLGNQARQIALYQQKHVKQLLAGTVEQSVELLKPLLY